MSGRKQERRPTPPSSHGSRFRWRLAAGCLVLVAVGVAAFEDVRVPERRAPSRTAERGQAEARSRSEPPRFQPLAPPKPSAAPVVSTFARATAPAASQRSWAGAALESAHVDAAASVQVPPPLLSVPVVSAAPAVPSSKPHRVPFALLAAWSKPGLCSSASDAVAVRDKITADFRELSPDDGGKLYLDPRLPADAEQAVVEALRRTEAEVGKRLALRPPRPLTFVYADQPLMKAAACINENVVAFYDGALHIVANRRDVLQSVLHEYTHHALFNAGVVTPAWAQEGIAMNVAQERWWRNASYLLALVAHPFSLEQMEKTIPYKLPNEQALAFYVQSAALVECLLQARKWALPDLLAALRSGSSPDSLTYDLPELDQHDFLLDCLQGSRR